MKTYQHENVSISYLEQGTGKPIFLIHGLGADHAMFDPQITSFSKEYRIIAPDLRGNGLSSKLEGPVSSVLDRQCADIVGLMDALEIDKAVFCGVSYGGVFNFHFALNHPEKVAGLIISDSFSDTKVKSIAEFFNLIALYIGLPMLYFPSLLKPAIAKSYKRWPVAQKYMAQTFGNLRSQEVILQRLAINAANHTPELHQCKMPVLGLVGDDVPLLISYMQRAMGQLENSQLIILENSFDPSNLCAAEPFNKAVSEYLAKIGW